MVAMEAGTSILIIHDNNDDDDKWSMFVGFQWSLNYRMNRKEDILFLTKLLVYEWWSLNTCSLTTLWTGIYSGLSKQRELLNYALWRLVSRSVLGWEPYELEVLFQNATLRQLKSWVFMYQESENFIACRTLWKYLVQILHL